MAKVLVAVVVVVVRLAAGDGPAVPPLRAVGPGVGLLVGQRRSDGGLQRASPHRVLRPVLGVVE